MSLVLVILGVFGGCLLGLTVLVLLQQLPHTTGRATGSSVIVPDGASSSSGVTVSLDPGSGLSDQPTSAGVLVDTSDGSDLESYASQLLGLVIRDGVVVLLGGLVVAAPLVLWQANRILRPLGAMASATRRVSEQTLSERVPVDSERDEFGQLATELNAMLDRLEYGYRYERMLSSAASHELFGPMAAQRTYLEVTLSDPDADAAALRKACEVVLDQNRGLERITEAILTLGRARNAVHEQAVPLRIDLAIARMVEEVGVGDDLAVSVRLDEVTLCAHAASLDALLRNLISNAVSHNIPGGWIRIDLTGTSMARHRAVLTVANSCPPIDRAELGELSKPFRRSDTHRSSTTASVGLGLTIIDAIGRMYDWPTTIASPEPGVFRVRVEIPPSE